MDDYDCEQYGHIVSMGDIACHVCDEIMYGDWEEGTYETCPSCRGKAVCCPVCWDHGVVLHSCGEPTAPLQSVAAPQEALSDDSLAA